MGSTPRFRHHSSIKRLKRRKRGRLRKRRRKRWKRKRRDSKKKRKRRWKRKKRRKWKMSNLPCKMRNSILRNRNHLEGLPIINLYCSNNQRIRRHHSL